LAELGGTICHVIGLEGKAKKRKHKGSGVGGV